MAAPPVKLVISPCKKNVLGCSAGVTSAILQPVELYGNKKLDEAWVL
jgi:hypothetical protein